MLTFMRSKVSGYFAKAMMILLVISFAIWGVGDIARNDFGTVVARVGDDPIPMSELQRATRIFARAAEAQGITVDMRLLQRQMLRQMIEERLTRHLLRDMGLSVGEPLLARELRQAPALLKADGSFSAERFRLMLQQRQITEEGFLAQLKTDIENQTLIESASAEELAFPDSYLALNARAAGQTRDIVLVTIPAAAMNPPAATEEELKDYYELQKDLLYMQPERRTLEYATIAPADIDRLVAKEKETAAEEARDRVMQDVTSRIEDALAGGKGMAEALQAAGIRTSTRTLAGITADGGKDALTNDVVKEGFALGEGETSNLEVAKGGVYFLVTVKSVTPAAPKPYEAVKADVTKRLAAEARRDAVTLRARDVAQALANNTDWKTVLAGQKLSGRSMQGVGRESGGTLPQPLREAIFEHRVGETAGPLAQPDGDALIAIVTAVHPGRTKNLSEKAHAALKEDMKQEVFAQYFNQLAHRYPVTVNDAVFAKAEKGISNE